MKKAEKWLSFLGLANRAGKIVTGEELVVKEIQKQRVKLVLIANDASENTMKKIQDKCNYYHVPVKVVSDRYTLGESIGKHARVVIAIMDDGFSKKLLTMLD
ncbi:YlxQ family RNA-binding protein [Caldibacillus lycopersici]|uniref:YlxQ family RNA-binding protein n=1 Tax=Perspicuibacillus lycopersici TaxID=1325689 RepID=A0AAE3IPA9_9BACI|nr:YlxQ family RNA-binding protein [Perspicuibacillus lycopersici]MCU9612065.1 YlxQ family RNA-binding protein [Perspicuibacillus lycopersici]